MKNKLQMAINVLLIIFTPLMIYINISNTKINVAMADILLVLVAIIFLFNIKEFFIQKRWRYLLYFVGLLLSLFLSQYVSKFNYDFIHVNNSVMIIEMVKTFVVAMYFFTAFILVKNEREFRLSLIAISISSIPIMIIGFTSYVYFFQGRAFFIDIYKIETSRFLGSFGDPNLCALYFILVFFVSLLNFKVLKNKSLRLTMAGISILSFIIILLTMSRGGWLALGAAMTVFIILNLKNLNKEILLIVITVGVIVLISTGLDYHFQHGKITNEMVSRVQDSLITDVGDIDRIQLMKAAFSMGNDNFFFGVGKGGFPLNSYKYLSKDNIQYKKKFIPHNTILGFYAQQGIIGVLIFVILPGHILYIMLKHKRKQNLYFIPLFAALFVHSMTINVENVRFLWYILGLILAAEKLDINFNFEPSAKMNKRTFSIVLTVLLSLTMLISIDISRMLASNIYLHKGDTYIRGISVATPGDYELTFDIQTDDHLSSLEIYDGPKLLKGMDFKSACGVVYIPIYLENKCRIVLKSNQEGWVKVRNAYIIGYNQKVPLYDYILLPRYLEEWLNARGLLVYADVPSFKKQFEVENDKLNAFKIFDAKVIRYSNLSHAFQFDLESKEKVDTNYQLDLLMDYSSISDMFPDEGQENLWSHRFTLSPHTDKWEKGQSYTVKNSKLFISEGFTLYGRYYDYANKVYSQDSYFPIKYDIVKENQDIIPLGESQWINIRYNKDKKDIIHITNNGWVESGRMNLEPGDYKITFKAQGSFLDEYSKVKLLDNNLNEITEITLDDTMKEHTVRYHTDKYQQGMSFVLELVNYKSENGVGNRQVLLQDWLKVK